MEPGHEDREDQLGHHAIAQRLRPQWSPVMKTGKTRRLCHRPSSSIVPQWSPVMKTGKTRLSKRPGLYVELPQWSPVMKTGKTMGAVVIRRSARHAAMEPGHEDREDL